MPAFQLLTQSFVERKSTRFCASVINVLRVNQKTSHASNSDDMSVISLDHCWDELFDEKKMRDSVDVENSAHFSFRFIEDRFVGSNSRIVDQNCRVSVIFADLFGRFVNIL